MSKRISVRVKISTAWGTIERREAIADLAAQLGAEAAAERPLDRTLIVDTCERIQFLATASPVFLENNREKIMEGQ